MKKSLAQLTEEYETILRIKEQAEQSLLAIPGVRCVSVGMIVTNDLPTEELGFRVYVEEKKPMSEIPASEQIPESFNDIKIDVEEIDTHSTASAGYDKGKYRPLCGGIAIHSEGSPLIVGTLGCLVSFEKETDEDEIEEIACLLTNYHVLRADAEEEGHQIAQPDFCCEAWCCRCGEIARLETWADIETENVDCAIARLTKGNEDNWVNEVLELGPIFGTLPDNTKLVAGETVFKRGARSGLTEGIVIDPSAPVGPVGFQLKGGPASVSFTNQILIKPKSPDKPFTSKGDSGAVVLNHLNQVVGLYFADNEQRDDNDTIVSKATRSWANPIKDVLDALKIKILESGSLYSIPLKSSAAVGSTLRIDIWDDLSRKLEQTPEGALILELIHKHRSEVLRLINHNREVKVSWHRLQGPAFVAHFMEKENKPGHRIPLQIEGISYRRLLSKMSVVLEKNGSPELAASIDRHAVQVLGALEQLIGSLDVNAIAETSQIEN